MFSSSSSFSRAGETEESVERENCVSSVCDVAAEILMGPLLPRNGRSDVAIAAAVFVVVVVIVFVIPLAVSDADDDDDDDDDVA